VTWEVHLVPVTRSFPFELCQGGGSSLFLDPPKGEKPSFTKLDPKTMELAMSLGRVFGLRNEVKGLGDKPEGVKLGDASKILLWFKAEGWDKYQAIYGDLHVGDVAADALPEKPQP
jgi:hypothetical protein